MGRDLQCAVSTVKCAVYSVKFEVCIVQCTVCTVQCTAVCSAVPGSPCVSYPAAQARISGGNFRGLIAINCREHGVPDFTIHFVLTEIEKAEREISKNQ